MVCWLGVDDFLWLITGLAGFAWPPYADLDDFFNLKS